MPLCNQELGATARSSQIQKLKSGDRTSRGLECGGYDSVSWLKMVSTSSQKRSNNKNQHALVDDKSQFIIGFFCGFSAHVSEFAIGCGDKH